MSDMKRWTATVTFDGWQIEGEDLAERIRQCIETHPTLSFRVDTVHVKDYYEVLEKKARTETAIILANSGVDPSSEQGKKLLESRVQGIISTEKTKRHLAELRNVMHAPKLTCPGLLTSIGDPSETCLNCGQPGSAH